MIDVKRMMRIVIDKPMITRRELTRILFPPSTCVRKIRNDFYRAQDTLKGELFKQKDGQTIYYCTCDYAKEHNIQPDVEVINRDRKVSKDPDVLLMRWLDRIMIPHALITK